MRKLLRHVEVFGIMVRKKRYYNEVVGTNSRLDEVQTGLLRARMKHLDELTQERQRIAKRYAGELENPMFKKR